MDAALIMAGLAMGVAASPHCAGMCGAPCAAITSGCRRNAGGFHLGRLLGYMAGGAVAASSVELLGRWSEAAPALRPLWMMLQLAFLALGLWWLITGRPLDWMKRSSAVNVRMIGIGARPMRSGIAGLAWVAWPCGALQGALLVAAMARTPAAGALVMGGFALASAPALAAAPWLWSRWRAVRGGTLASSAPVAALGYRVAGLGIALSSGWALTHGLWERVAGWCGF